MKFLTSIAVVMISGATMWAQTEQRFDQNSPAFKTGAVKPRGEAPPFRHEASVSYGYTAGAKAKYGSAGLGDISSQNADLNYVLTSKLSPTIFLRTGLGWDMFSFGFSQGTPLPNTLQSVHATIGADFILNDDWSLRAEIKPGVYSDMQDISSDDFNCPALVGAMWKMNDEVRWFFGLSANPWSDIPILPAAGARWKFADRWTLNAVFPSPRIQYELTEQWTLFTGARLLGGTYRVSRDLGTQSGQPQLNNAILSYREIRLGGGAEWKINPAMTLQLDAGYAVNRRFEYPRANDQITGEGAPYAQVGLATAF